MVIKELIDRMRLKHEARRLSARPDATPASKVDVPIAGPLVRATPAAKKEKAAARKSPFPFFLSR